jgi:HSP20 family protein
MAMDPFADLLTLQREMDRIMTKFGAHPQHMTEEQGQNLWTPAVDVFKQGQDMVVRAELPGVNPADINVSVTGNMLTLKGERRQERQTGDDQYVMRETTYGSFERRVTMPEDIDAGQVRAQYRAGVLEVTIPQSAFLATQPHNVAVQGAQQQQSMTAGTQQGMGAGMQAGTGTQQAAGMETQQGRMGQTDTSQYQQTAVSGREQRPEDYRTGSEQQRQESMQTAGAPQQYAPEQSTAGQQGYGGTQGEAQQVPPVQTQGGWVTPESQTGGQSMPSEQQVGTSYEYGQQEQQGGTQPDRQQEEERGRSRLGGWLHGER